FFSCGQSCTQHINYGTTLSIGETPAQYWQWGGWSGGTCSGTGGCTVSGPATVNATFNLPTYTLTVNAGYGGTAGVVGSATSCSTGCTYSAGTQVSVTSSPTLLGWNWWKWVGTGVPSTQNATFV